MADIELVIKIPEDEYNIAKYGQYGNINIDIIRNAIKNGTPLPKEHGRLIDADELKKHKYHDNDRFENAVSVAQIDWVPTIIEAEEDMNNEFER